MGGSSPANGSRRVLGPGARISSTGRSGGRGVGYTRLADDDRDRPCPRAGRGALATATDLLRDPAVRRAPPRQRPGRDPQLREAPVGVRGDLLHRRLPRADEPPRPRRAPDPDARDGRVPDRPGPGPRALHAVRPEPPAGGHGARLAADDRHAGQLAGAHADVQGEEAAAAGRRQPRTAQLPGAAGRRHRPLQGVARARREGPGGAPGAIAGDRAPVQHALWRHVPRAPGGLHRIAHRPGHGRCAEDVQVARQHHRHPRAARRR